MTTPSTTDIYGWAMTGVAAVVTVLAGAVTKLWLKTVSDADRREKDLIAENVALKKEFEVRLASAEKKIDEQVDDVKECHRQREELRVKLAAMETRLELVESRMHCPLPATNVKPVVSIEHKG
jgi:PleD family two-component response regulator